MESTDGLLQIGAAAERVGLSLRTVRYWDEVGLVRPSARTDGGFRLYSEVDIEMLRVVMSMKPLGLTLEEMAELLSFLEPEILAGESPARVPTGSRDGLRDYAERAARSIQKLDRQRDDARKLQRRMLDKLAELEEFDLPQADVAD